jgi:teichuronic acid biosynthesis glycosyltransferase TuaC
MTFHGSDLNTWPKDRSDRLTDLRAAMRGAAAVITVSRALAERARELAGVNAIHLPLGSDHRRLRQQALPRDLAREAFGLDGDRIVVLFIGNLLAAKGVRELADAILPRWDRFRAVFVGDGPLIGYGRETPRGAEALDYCGAVPHDEIARYLSAADVLVLPSRREGLPTVLVEAGSLGLPVIASHVGGIPDLLAEDRGRVIEEVSAEAIGEALDAFESDRPGARAQADRLRAFVVEQHDVETNSRQLSDLYRSIGMPDKRTRP